MPEFIKGYKVIKKLGAGKDAEVFLVRDIVTGHEFALKKINQNCPARYIKNEIIALQLVRQLGMEPKLYEVFEEDGVTYLLLQLLLGWDLIRYIEKTGPMPEIQAIIFLRQILKMLQLMQQHQLLHLDIKPNNILYDAGRFFLADWGRAEQSDVIPTLDIIGNSIYLAPEVFVGARNFSSEIYSLGCVLYFAVTGNIIYSLDVKHSFAQKMYAHFFFQPEFPERVTPKLAMLIKAMLEKDPAKRITLEQIDVFLQSDKNHVIDYKFRNVSVDFSSELQILEVLAEAGVPYALNFLARKYRYGKMVPANMYKFIELNKQAAKFNLARSLSDLGEANLKGLGIAKNSVAAFEFFLSAAKLNFNFAQYQLALLYKKGTGVQANATQADYWLRRAADNGNVAAINQLKEALIG